MMKLEDILVTRNWVGKATPRKEDVRLVRGAATFIDDLDMNCYHTAFLGSLYAHARIKSVDTSRAEKLKGVVATITGGEVKKQTQPVVARAITEPAVQYVMGVDKVRYVGEPVAAVVAENAYIAEDALELIDVEYEPLSPVMNIADALNESSPLVFEEAGSNILLHDLMEHGSMEEAHKEADLVVKEKFNIQRFSSTPLENWGIIAQYDRARDSFTVWANDQQHGRSMVNVCHTLGISNDQLRIIVPDIGGSFGIKLAIWPYMAILSLLAKKVDKPVKWIQTRTAHLMVGTHTPDAELEIELAVKKDGTILGLSLKDIQNDGSFIHTAGIYALIKFTNIVGCYQIKSTRTELMSVVTNKSPTVQNRGVGKPAMIFVLERMVDIAAKKLGLEPTEMRFKNFVQPAQMPYKTPSGEIYESGDYPKCFQKALDMVEYEKVRKQQQDLREKGRYLGVGMSTGIEPGTSNLGYYNTSRGTPPEYMGNAEGAMVGMDFDGNVNLLLGSVDSGQGHATTASQVVADMLGIHVDRVSVSYHMDSMVAPFLGHSGVYSNKFNDVDLGAVILATKKIRDKMLKIAAHNLEVEEQELQLKDGAIAVKGKDKAISFKDLASLAYKRILLLPDGVEPGLKAIAYYKSPYAKLPSRTDFNVQITHSNGVHVVVVEVDVETGVVHFLRYVISHDCGKQINPGVVEGMAIGSTVHGIGTALYEEFVYSEEGQLLTSTFMDYLKPISVGLPRFEIGHLESPCPYTLLGTKAVGEGGSITSLAAIANAVEDALSPFGVKITSLPITPQKIIQMIGGPASS